MAGGHVARAESKFVMQQRMIESTINTPRGRHFPGSAVLAGHAASWS